MKALATVFSVLLILGILLDAFETVVLPRRVTRRIRFARAFYRVTWIPSAALARQGVRSLVLEKEPGIPPQSRALGILARTLEIFRGWGVKKELGDVEAMDLVRELPAPTFNAGPRHRDLDRLERES